MFRQTTTFLLTIFLFTLAPASAQSFAQIVGNRDFESARLLARKVIQTAGISLSLGPADTDQVAPGAKLAARFVLTDRPINPLRMTGCVVFAAAPIKTGSYINHCLVVSTSNVESGSYISNSAIISTQGVRIGSYSTSNTIQAESVSVGSYSANSRYFNVKPRVGKSSKNDELVESTALNELLGF